MIVTSCLYEEDDNHAEILDVVKDALRKDEELRHSSSIPELKKFSTQEDVRFIVLGGDCCSWRTIEDYRDGKEAGPAPIIHYRVNHRTVDAHSKEYEGPTVTIVRNHDELRLALGILVTDEDVNEVIASITTTIQSREA